MALEAWPELITKRAFSSLPSRQPGVTWRALGYRLGGGHIQTCEVARTPLIFGKKKLLFVALLNYACITCITIVAIDRAIYTRRKTFLINDVLIERPFFAFAVAIIQPSHALCHPEFARIVGVVLASYSMASVLFKKINNPSAHEPSEILVMIINDFVILTNCCSLTTAVFEINHNLDLNFPYLADIPPASN